MAKKSRNIFNALFLIIVFAATMYFVFYDEDLEKIAEYIKGADSRYWLPCILIVIVFIESEAVIIFYMLKSLGEDVRLSHCCLYSFVGFFFILITPSASGGQPAQLYFMKKDKLSLTVSTMVLVIVTITYKLVLVVVGTIVFIFRPTKVMYYLEPVTGWCILGMVLNVACIFLMLVFVFHKDLAENIAAFLLSAFFKVFKRKNKEKYIKKLGVAMEKYRGTAEYFSSHKLIIWNVFCITVFQRVIFFMMTYIVCLSFNVADEGVFVITSLQTMVSVAVDMLPFPGGMGITEKLFEDIFTPLCGSKLVLPVMIVTRAISYYTQLFISAIMSVVAYRYIILGRGTLENDRIL